MTDTVAAEEAAPPSSCNDVEEDLMSLIGDTLGHKQSVETAKLDSTADVADSVPDATSSPSTPTLKRLCDIAAEISGDSPTPQISLHSEPTVKDGDSATREGDCENSPNHASQTLPESSVQKQTPFNDSPAVEEDSKESRIAVLEELLSTEKSLRTKTEADMADVQAKLSTSISERDAYLSTIRQLKEDHAVFAANGKAHYEKKLQDVSAQLNHVAKQAKDRDQMARNAIEKLKQESSQKINDMQKKLEVAVREKDLMVVRYAEGETKVIKVENEKEKLAKTLSDITKDKDVLLGKVKLMRDEKVKMQQAVDAKQAEMANMQKEVDRVMENFRQSEQKARWLQGKMAAETEGMGELKLKVERLAAALKDAKEDAEKSKKHYENVIRDYQKKEEEKETDTTVREQEKEVKRIIDEQLIQDKERTETGLKSELETARKKAGEMLAENNSLRTRYKRIEEEKLELVSQLNDVHQELLGKKTTIGQLTEEMQGLENRLTESENLVKMKEGDVVAANQRVEDLERSIQSMKEAYEESHVEVDNYSARNAELLSFTEKVSSKNTQLLSETVSLKSQLTSLTIEKDELLKTKKEADDRTNQLKANHEALLTRFETVKKELEGEVTAKTEAAAQLQQQLEDEKNEIKVMKKKHAMAIKELSREIQGASAKKFFEGSHGSGASSDTAATLNSGSRAGSMTSLDNVSGKEFVMNCYGKRNTN